MLRALQDCAVFVTLIGLVQRTENGAVTRNASSAEYKQWSVSDGQCADHAALSSASQPSGDK